MAFTPGARHTDSEALSDALERVAELARQGILDDDDPGMADEVDRQTEAVAQFEDLVGNLHEEIDGFFQDQGGVPALAGDDGEIPDIDLDDVRAAMAESSLDYVSTVMELACQQLIDDIDPQDHEAVDLAGAFFARQGRELVGNITSVTMPPGFFD